MSTSPTQITCPACQHQISITDALASDLREGMKQEYDQQLAKSLSTLRTELGQQYSTQLADLETRLQSSTAALAQTDAREQAVQQRQRELDDQQRTLTQEIERQVQAKKQVWQQAEGTALRAQLHQELSTTHAAKLRELEERLAHNQAALAQAEQAEMTLRKQARELEDRERRLTLETERRIDAARQEWEGAARDRVTQEYQRTLSEKDLQLDSMRRQIEELRQKATQGSQQLQGEALELQIETHLSECFPHDKVEPVPKGVRGADVIHHVITPRGEPAGTILWETKRTKNWSPGWLEKLREDQRLVTADCALLVTQTLPSDLHHFGYVDGIWVSTPEMAVPLATALRVTLLQLAQAKQAEIGKHLKTELVYQYLTGTQFRQRVEAIVEAFVSLQGDLEREKRAMQRLWASREKQLQRAILAAGGMHGDIRGILGATLPEIPQLALDPTAGTDPQSDSPTEELLA